MYRGIRQAVIMVGGMGTRLRPLTLTRPKPILPVADKPCLGYLIDSFVRGGIEEIILACGYRSQQLVEAIGDGSDRGISIEYSFEDEPMGTGGAIKLLEDRLDDVFVAANGDVFADFDLRQEIDAHYGNDADITLALTPVDNPWEFGTACTDGSGRIYKFIERPKKEEVVSNMINAGIYIVKRGMIGYIPSGQMYDFSKDLVPSKLESRRIWGHRMEGIWMDVGRRKDLIGANMVMAERVRSTGSASDTETSGPVYLGSDAVVQSSTLKGASIMRGAFVTDSEIVNSVVMPGARICGARIVDSVIGENAVVNISSIVERCLIGDGAVIEKNTAHTDEGGKHRWNR